MISQQKASTTINDSTHYKPNLGGLILSRIFHYHGKSVPADFGYVLTSDNIEKYLLMIRVGQKKYRVNYPDQVMEIESMAKNMILMLRILFSEKMKCAVRHGGFVLHPEIILCPRQ